MQLFSKAFFALQLDFARVISQHFSISFEEALYKYTSIYTRLIGFSDFDPPHEDHPRWQEVMKNLPSGDQLILDYFYDLYLDYEKNKTPAVNSQTQFGCFSYVYQPAKNKFSLHFHAVDPQGNLGKNRVSARMKDLKELFASMKREQKSTAQVYVTTWLLKVNAFNRLLPPEFINSQQPRNKGVTQDNGWWGQFVDRHGGVKEDLEQQFRNNIKTKHDLVDEYFPLRTMRATANQAVFYKFYKV